MFRYVCTTESVDVEFVAPPNLVKGRLVDIGLRRKDGVIRFRRLKEKKVGSRPKFVA